MNIHEYQAKELFRRYGIAVPAGRVVCDVDEVASLVEELSYPLVVKAQIHAGGRGKGGGVRVVDNEAALGAACREMLGMTLVTRQTGPAGRTVRRLLIEEAATIEREFYLAMLVDRNSADIAIMASRAGGMEIEETAARAPESIVRVHVHPLLGVQGYQCRQVADGLGLEGAAAGQLAECLRALYEVFTAHDCSLAEINPLVLTTEGGVMAIDAKLTFDDNALFRHPEIRELADPLEEDPLEAEAAAAGLNYIKLDGNIGAMVNGAGLAMATMDMIGAAGAHPANFLDVGGGASAERVEKGFSIIVSDPAVRGILVNIFGGILRCDVLAEGIVAAAANGRVAVPVVVRMEGTNAGEGRKILARSGLDLRPAADLKDAAVQVAAIVGVGQ